MSEIYPELINESSLNMEEVVALLKTVYDPEIHYDIYQIGLIYKVHLMPEKIDILMTLTSVSCPEAQSLPDSVLQVLEDNYAPEYKVTVDLTFDPAWTVDNMSEEVKLGMGLL